MKHLHSYFTLFTAVTLLASSPLTAFAEDREKITSVNITIEANNDDDHNDFDDLDLNIYTDDDDYSVDGYEVTGTSSSHPVITVTLKAEDDYYFSVSNDDIDIDGEEATLSSKSTKDSKETLVLKIKLTDISSEIDSNDLGDADLGSDGVGSWDNVNDAKKYEVRFYRGSSLVGSTITTKNNEYYFGSLITKTGNYSFKVRAIDTDNESTDWVESNTRYFSYDPDGTSPVNFSSSSSDTESSASDKTSSSDKTASSSGSPDSDTKGWIHDEHGWWYKRQDGSYPVNEWLFVDENWFHFNQDGYMQLGWIKDGDNYYYLNPVSDGTLGRMITGWHWIDGKCYYFNPASDGSKGAMMSNTIIDGQYRLGADGAMIQ